MVIGTKVHRVAGRRLLGGVSRRATGPASPRRWGATPPESQVPLPCDRFMLDPDATYDRAIDVDASASVVFRWLCQLRAAPYSYDWIDNLGRRSPPALTPGLERLAVGQTFMTVFELVDFEPDLQLTLLTRRLTWLLGEASVTYAVRPAGARRCRLLVRVRVRHPGGRLGAWAMDRLMPRLDLVMMRRQLLNLRALAEADGTTSV